MKTGRNILISAILALSAAGSVLGPVVAASGPVTPVAAAPASYYYG